MIFITGNANKLTEYQQAIPNITSQKLDLPELQGQTGEEIAILKAEEAYQQIQSPCFTEDVSLELAALGGFPGPYIKWFLHQNNEEAIHRICSAIGNTQVTAKAILGLKSSKDQPAMALVGEVSGQIVSPRGDSRFGFDNIFQPDGSMKTFGEMTREEKHQYSHRGRAIAKLQEFLKSK